jgi:hypothetical protein
MRWWKSGEALNDVVVVVVVFIQGKESKLGWIRSLGCFESWISESASGHWLTIESWR